LRCRQEGASTPSTEPTNPELERTLLDKGKDARAVALRGQRHDCGSKMGYLEAVVDFALEHPDYAEPFGELVDSKAAARKARADSLLQRGFEE
jgi:hypothetical protein